MQPEVFGPFRVVRRSKTPAKDSVIKRCDLPRTDADARIKALAAKVEAHEPLFSATDRNTAEERGEVVEE